MTATPIDYRCGFCGAKKGDRCRTASGAVMTSDFHRERVEAAIPDQLRDRLASHLFIEQYPEGSGSDYDGADYVLEMVSDSITRKFGLKNEVSEWLDGLAQT